MNWNPVEYRIFETVTGSKMYGTNSADSDDDLRGVCIPPQNVLLDPFNNFEQKDSFEGQDRCLYGLAKFLKLASDANPNVLELLFAPESLWTYHDNRWLTLVGWRKLFLSKKVKYTFSGFAHSQLEALKRHRKWFTDPPDHEPTRAEFGLGGAPKVSGQALLGLNNVPFECLTLDFRDEVRRENAYRAAMESWRNYVSWRDNRNPARKALEEKFGYDTKYAAHTLRVLDQGKELLKTGLIVFPRPNADWLKAVRFQGLLSFEAFVALAEEWEQDLDVLYEQSTLPFGPDRKGLTELYYVMLGVEN